MYEEAIAELNKRNALGGYTEGGMQLAYIYAVSGRRAEAMKLLDELKEQSKTKRIAVWVAVVYSGLGDRDQAFEWLEKAYRERRPAFLWFRMKVDPYWDNIRTDPRFADLLRRIGLPP